MAAGGRQREVWLRGNIRPAVAVAVAAAGIAGLAILALRSLPMPPWAMAVISVLAGAIVVAAGGLAWASAQPRLAIEGDAIMVRLAPQTVERVPLAVVECVFRGTEPVAAEQGPPRFRVGTLVLRLAERATDWRQRPSFPPWGSWEDGHIVIDGRWCEPLSPESARLIATRLADAKRTAPGDCPP